MDRVALQAKPRIVLGKKVRTLRRQGITPANLFGHGLASKALEVETKELVSTLRHAGINALITLTVEGDKEQRTVMIREAQRDPRTQRLLHVDFYQVRMNEPIKAAVPLAFVGESPAAKATDRMVLPNLDELRIECLPGDLPHAIEVDISGLEDTDQAIHVRDLRVPPGVKVLDEGDTVVIRVMAQRAEEELVEEVAAEPELVEEREQQEEE